MILTSISLQNFRNYTKSEFGFSPRTTIIVGPNAIGKSNLIEAIYVIATGKSNRSEKQNNLIKFGENLCRIKAELASPVGAIPPSDLSEQAPDKLEVVFSETGTGFLQRKYLVNGVSKRRADLAGRMPVVEFSPLDLDIVSGAPSIRRRFLDDAIESVDEEYRHALAEYIKTLRQRNALLHDVQESGVRDEARFLYWDDLLITNGRIVAKKRAEFINYINEREKELFGFDIEYDESEISRVRLDKYKNAEIGAGVTLVGPHRDDFKVLAKNKYSKQSEEVRYFGSRGQQRLVALELKLSQIALINERLKESPILLLDDVFSELDESNINLVLDLMDQYQTIATTTHREFIEKNKIIDLKVIELG